MAQAIQCDFCRELPAVFMIGNMSNGDQEAACQMCLVNWARNIVSQFDAFMAENQEPAGESGAGESPVVGDGDRRPGGGRVGNGARRRKSPKPDGPTPTETPAAPEHGRPDDGVDVRESAGESAS